MFSATLRMRAMGPRLRKDDGAEGSGRSHHIALAPRRHSASAHSTDESCLPLNPTHSLTSGLEIVSNSGFPARIPCKRAFLWLVGLA